MPKNSGKNYTISTKTKPAVLVYLFGSLGDTLVAIPALRAVRRHFDNFSLILLQNIPANENIVRASQVIPDNLIDEYLEYPNKSGKFNRISGFYDLRRKLRRYKFQAAVYLVISERKKNSVARDKLFFRTVGISDFYGFNSFSKEDLYPFDKNGRPALTDSEAVRKISRLEKDGIRSLPDDFRQPFLSFSALEIKKIKCWLASRRKKADAHLISIAPGCKTEANVWSDEKFIEIGRRILAADDCELVVVGGKGEQKTAQKFISAWGQGINAAGEFSVRESGALLSMCDFHFGLDTGTTHLAAAAGTSCFALYGERNNPGQWFPAGSGHTILFHPVECCGCRAFVCPVSGHPCMSLISVESVWHHLEDFMGSVKNMRNSRIRLIAV